LAFAEQNDLRMRGHCLYWEKAKYVQPWLAGLNGAALVNKIDARMKATAGRYAGRVVSWDVDNEQLDGSFYRDRIGRAGVAQMFKEAAALDPKAILFLNEYGILGNPEKTDRYLALIRELRSLGAPVGGIGIQSHDLDRLVPNAISNREDDKRPEWLLRSPLSAEQFIATLDKLHNATGLPIHLTEASAKMPDPVNRAEALDILYHVGFGHPAVGAIMLWGFEASTHWMGPDAALLAADGSLTEAGRCVDDLMRKTWTTHGTGAADSAGRLGFRGFYGIYHLKITLPDGRIVEQDINLDKANAGGVQTIRL
jgi:GH35 family endo-1,4-beta-xylanase